MYGFLGKMVLYITIFTIGTRGTLIGLPASQLAQQDSGNVACITEPPITINFPDVQINARFFDSRLEPLPDITPDTLQISENNSSPIDVQSVATSERETALDSYFVIDVGNRTDQFLVKEILQGFALEMKDNFDTVTVLTDKETLGTYDIQTTRSTAKLNEYVRNYNTSKPGEYHIANYALAQAVEDLKVKGADCSRQNALFIVTGNDALDVDRIDQKVISELALSNTKVYMLNLSNSTDGSYRSLMDRINGVYFLYPSTDIETALNKVEDFRKTYDIKYTTNNGDSGVHQTKAYHNGQAMDTRGTNSYEIALEVPTVSLSLEDPTITRVAQSAADTGYIYGTNSVPVRVSVNWHGFPRKILAAKLQVNNNAPVNVILNEVNSSGDITDYQFDWNLSGFDQSGRFPVNLTLEIIDTISSGNSFSGGTAVEVNNKVVIWVALQRYLTYAVFVPLGIIVLLVVAFFIWRKKIIEVMQSGKAGRAVISGIRKGTDIFVDVLTGGARRKNPIAQLHVVEGPTNMMGINLPIYTDFVKLGRDSQRSDITFFNLEIISSVSGYHCKLERVQGEWKISATSTSQSPTYIDNNVLPFNEPRPLSNGQMVRLGNLGHMPVEFRFDILEDPSSMIPIGKTPSKKGTDVNDIDMPKFGPKNKPPEKSDNKNSDSKFDKYRKDK
jgi:hypothetical protein